MFFVINQNLQYVITNKLKSLVDGN